MSGYWRRRSNVSIRTYFLSSRLQVSASVTLSKGMGTEITSLQQTHYPWLGERLRLSDYLEVGSDVSYSMPTNGFIAGLTLLHLRWKLNDSTELWSVRMRLEIWEHCTVPSWLLPSCRREDQVRPQPHKRISMTEQWLRHSVNSLG